jgi:hypothetical protein
MVVLYESKYEEKLNTLLEPGVYEPLSKDPTAKVERKIQKLLSKHKLLSLTTASSIWSSQDPQTGHSSEASSVFYWFPLLCPGRLSPSDTKSSCWKFGILR